MQGNEQEHYYPLSRGSRGFYELGMISSKSWLYDLEHLINLFNTRRNKILQEWNTYIVVECQQRARINYKYIHLFHKFILWIQSKT